MENKKTDKDNKKANDSPESLVLNISGRKYPQRNRQIRNSTANQAAPVFNVEQFPNILSRILKCEDSLVSTKYSVEYVGVVCLINHKTQCRIYHMFCTNMNNYGEDYDKVVSLYKKDSDIRVKNNICSRTTCALVFYRAAQEYFKEYKWNKEGSAFETPRIANTNEYTMSNKLHQLLIKEEQKLVNYIKFMKLYS